MLTRKQYYHILLGVASSALARRQLAGPGSEGPAGRMVRVGSPDGPAFFSDGGTVPGRSFPGFPPPQTTIRIATGEASPGIRTGHGQESD